RLKSEDAVVVIGGQQAGLLTGPLYSINKVISIISLAKRQEAELNRPVIPVFWIAGEDHDFDEINHVNIRTDKGIKKHTIPHFPETDLVLAYTTNESLRGNENEYFIKLIEHRKPIAKTVSKTIQSLQKKDYSITLEAEENEGHLFYHDNQGERILLNITESGLWQGKTKDIVFTSEELVQIAKDTPHRLSNNVVTRPLMQEWVFPTLAFVGGYGEISYWASLKNAFKEVDLEMPPVVPRYSISYVPTKLCEALNNKEIDVSHAINFGVSDLKLNWLSNQSTAP